MSDDKATPTASTSKETVRPEKVDIAVHEFAARELNERHLKLTKGVDALQKENDKLSSDSDALQKAVAEGRADVKKVDDAKKAAKKSKEATLADLDQKVAAQRGTLKAEATEANAKLKVAAQEEKKAYEKVKDIEKTLVDVAATRASVKKADSKLKGELKASSEKAKELKLKETAVGKREVAVVTSENTAVNASVALEKREKKVAEREAAVKAKEKEVKENEASLNTRLKGIDGAREKAEKEFKRANTYYNLIDEARRDILTESYTEDDTSYKHLSKDQAGKVDRVVGDYLEMLSSVYEKKDS
jgi:uncharacterized protein (DUF3084 family)